MHVVWLNIAGLIDFVGAIGTRVLIGSTPIGLLVREVTTDIMNVMPPSLVPTFLVPFWIVLHIISLVQISRMEKEGIR